MTEKLQRIKESVQKIFHLDAPKIIFIYTPPKVGSTTLVTSLRVSLGKSCNVIHIHDDIMLNVLTGIKDVTVNDIINYMAESGKDVYVIDVYRTPIERKISDFFEKVGNFHFNNYEENISKYKIQRIINRFNKLFPYLALEEHYFEKYNISEPIAFDFSKKYTVQEINKIKYIKLRLCDSGIWNSILTQIMGLEIVTINDYQTDNKAIGELYKMFKNNYRLPINYFELIKGCKYLNFYYSEQERNNYYNDWQHRLSEPFVSYTNDEYKFYLNLCLENQHISDIQRNHYIDNGCYCNSCNRKRCEIFIRVKKGEVIHEKIIHEEVVQHIVENRIDKIHKLAQVVKKIIEVRKNKPTKFKKNQFVINNITK